MQKLGKRTIFTSTTARRPKAHAMFLAGATVDEVIEKLGLKRATANGYFWEAKQKAIRQGLIESDPLCK